MKRNTMLYNADADDDAADADRADAGVAEMLLPFLLLITIVVQR